MAATATVEQTDFTKQAEDLMNRLDEQGKDVSGAVVKSNTLAYMEEETEEEAMLGYKRDKRLLKSVMRHGYKPHSVFKTYRDYLREGIRAHNTDRGGSHTNIVKFGDRYAECFKAVQGMSSLTGGDGGFAVLPEFAPSIHDMSYDNDLFNRTDSYSISGQKMIFPRSAETSRVNGSRAGGIRGYWVEEGDPITDSNPRLATTELRCKKIAVVVFLTDELVDDNSYALEQWVNRKTTEEFNFMTGYGVMRGTGGAQMLGILNSSATLAIPRTAAGRVDAQDIVNMWARRKFGGNVSDYAWYINQDVEPDMHLMNVGVSTAGGQLVFMPPNGLSESPFATLMGRPVIPTEFNSSLGTAGDIALANLKDYVTITKGGIEQAQSIHVEFLTDQLALRFTLRVDGRPYDDQPCTPFQGTNQQSSFVTLAT